MKNILLLLGFSFLLVVGVFLLQNSSPKSSASSDHTHNISQKSALSSEVHTADIPCETSSVDLHVFMYHYIRDEDMKDTITTKELSVEPRTFRQELATIQKLAQNGDILLPDGATFFELLKRKCFPKKPVWIFTADDGWRDMYDTLFPLAQEYHVPFFFGIITDRMNTPGFVTEVQVQEMAKNPLITIASHSVSHREHDTMTEVDEHNELCTSKKILEKLTGKVVNAYIYPAGKISPHSAQIAQSCGYSVAWSTSRGDEDIQKNIHSRWQLNRTRVSHDTGAEFFEKIAKKPR